MIEYIATIIVICFISRTTYHIVKNKLCFKDFVKYAREDRY